MTIYDQLRRDEGERLKPYIDTVGKITIGVGRNLTDVGISSGEADIMLHNDVAAAILALTDNGYPAPSDTDARWWVLVNMAFNMGMSRLRLFVHMLSAYKSENWIGAAAQMRNSAWARQVGDRAERLAQQMETGIWT